MKIAAKGYEIEASAIETADLSLPYLLVAPHEQSTDLVSTVITPGIFGSIATRDALGLTYEAAEATRGKVIFLGWPGSSSPLPQDRELRRDMLRHGTSVAASAVFELIENRICIAPGATIVGQSLGFVRGLALAASFKPSSLPARIIGLDSAALGAGRLPMSIVDYHRHQKRAQSVGGLNQASVDAFYAKTEDIYLELFEIAKDGGLFWEPGVKEWLATNLCEATNIPRSARPIGLPYLRSILGLAELAEAAVSVEAHFVERTFALDKKAVDGLNNLAPGLRAKYPNSHLGFTQGRIGRWHDDSRRPHVMAWALNEGSRRLVPDLRHMYFSAPNQGASVTI